MTNALPTASLPILTVSRPAGSTLTPTLLIGGFILITVVLMLSGSGAGQLHLLFPAMAFAVGIYLYRKHPALYVSFTLWMWFLSPFVRRLVDFRSYWQDPNPILITPALVTGICAFTLLKRINNQWHSALLPYLLVGGGTTIGLMIGVALGNGRDAAGTYLLWTAPLCFGYYLQTFPSGTHRLKSTFVNTLIGFLLVSGTYAIFQFVTAPSWDCNWLELVSANSISPSFGQPNPFELRVWSTMNAPGPFSVALLVGLLILFVYSGWAKLPAALLGYTSFLLCLVRTSWASWLVAILLIAYFNRKQAFKLVLPILALSLAVGCLTQWAPVADKLHERFASTTAVGKDESVLDREHLYSVVPEYLLSHPLGRGLSNSAVFEQLPLDSGLLSTPLQLGWLGTGLLALGLIIQLGRSRLAGEGLTIERVCQIAAFALIIQILGSQIFTGLSALFVWG